MSRVSDARDPTRPAGIRSSTPYSPELESLRGWAILLVFVFHAQRVLAGTPAETEASPLYAFVAAGHTGVTLFFVLSAFLLARPFLQEGRGGRRVRRSDFYQRRALRIMPLYTAAVVAAVALSLPNPNALREGLFSLVFLNSITGVAHELMPYSAVWWSLATEVQFYLLLPVLGLCLRSRTGRAIGAAALVGWAGFYVAVATGAVELPIVARRRLLLSVVGRTPAFLSGILAAWVVLRFGDALRCWARSARWLRLGIWDLVLAGVLLTLGLFLQRVSAMGFQEADDRWTLWHVAESALWAATVLLVQLAPLRSARLISNRLLETLGLLSYSLYLIHVPVLFGVLLPFRDVAKSIGSVPVIAGALVLCAGLSAVTYRWIERPFLVRKARIDR